ncbi:Osi17.2 family protein, partial [Megaselia abdita]
ILPPFYNEHSHGQTPELIYTSPPKGGYIYDDPSHGHPSHFSYDESYSPGWEASGPGLGTEYINEINRKAVVDDGGNYFKLKPEVNDLQPWGVATPRPPTSIRGTSYNNNPFNYRDPQGKLRPVYVPQKQAASNIVAQYESPQKVQKSEAEINEALRIQAEKNLVLQQQKILEQQPFALDGGKPLMPKNYDPFYSPILEKVDKILNHLGFSDNYCKERVICSMYKNPSSFTPHSNFISAELSRDTSDLERPQTTNEAVIRFFRMIQAARNGQEQKNCLVLYPQCTIKTE